MCLRTHQPALTLSRGRGGGGRIDGGGRIGGGRRIGEAKAVGVEELARLGELAEVALKNVLGRRHVHLVVRADEDERGEVCRVHVWVREAAAEGEDLLDVALMRQVCCGRL